MISDTIANKLFSRKFLSSNYQYSKSFKLLCTQTILQSAETVIFDQFKSYRLAQDKTSNFDIYLFSGLFGPKTSLCAADHSPATLLKPVLLLLNDLGPLDVGVPLHNQ